MVKDPVGVVIAYQLFPAKDAPKCPPSKCAADLLAKAMARSGEAGEGGGQVGGG